MVTSDVRLWNTSKSRNRLVHRDEPEPRIVQIAGGEPGMMADAAIRNVELGAQIIDINLGCPAKKVCNHAAGSALMRDEPLVRAILTQVVAAAGVPVTLKMRTGWDRGNRNAVAIARLAEDLGMAALAVHGRTREDFFSGAAEYETVAAVKQSVSIPVIVNGDIDCPAKALKVLAQTGADGVMIGRAAQGRPWIFREVRAAMSRNDSARRLYSKKSVLSCFRTSRPFTRFTASYKESAWRASISVGIAGCILEVGHLPLELLTTGSAR